PCRGAVAQAVEGAGSQPVDEEVGAGEQALEGGPALGGAQVQAGGALAGHDVGGDRRLVPVRRVDPQHLVAEQGEVAGGDRAGEHPGEVEDPQSGQRSAGRTGEGERAAGGAVGQGDERLGGDGTALLVAGPLLRGAQGRGTAPGGVDGGLELLGRVAGDGGGDLLPRGGHAEDAQRGLPVGGGVGVQPHPPVGGAVVAGQRV